jgi:DNA-binding response OmpR family regulator
VAKILLIEDDRDLSAAIVLSLNAEKHTVDCAYRGDDGLDMLGRSQYDLIVLDLHLPGLDGMELLRQYRARRGSTPIVILTGKDHINDKEAGLDAGADDYLTKPFSTRELSARVRAVLRRPAQVMPNVLRVNDVELDTIKSTVTRGGAEVKLQPRDFALLEFFLKHPEQTFSIEALLEKVWNFDRGATADGLRTAVSRIRKALDSDDAQHSIIENIPKRGYRLGRAR